MNSSNTKLRSLILEDELKHQDTLRFLLARYCPQVEVVAAGDSVAEGCRLLQEYQADLLFLDVELRDGDCFELLEQAGSLSAGLIFTTAHDHYAIRALRFAALDYLLKPLVVSELKTAVNKVHSLPSGRSASRFSFADGRQKPGAISRSKHLIALATPSGFSMVHIDDILRLEAIDNYSKVYLRQGAEYIVSRSLQDCETLLADPRFCRVHKSHIINLEQVSRYVRGKGGYVVMSDGGTVNISIRRKEQFQQAYTRL